MRVAVICLLVIGGLRVTRAEKPAQDQLIEDLAARASAAQSGGQFELAANLYQELVAILPNVPELRVNAGLMLHLLGEYEAAVNHFRQAARANNKLFAANLFAGLDLLKLEQYTEASSYLTSAYALNGSDPSVNLALGQLYADLGDYERANGFYDEASRLDSRQADAWYGLAVTYLHVQRQALEPITEERAGAKYLDQVAHADFSRTQFERKELIEGLRTVRHGLNDSRALSHLAIVAGALAQQAIARVIELDPYSARVHVLLGNAYSELRDVAKAQEEFAEALSRDPGSFPAHLGLATMYAREGERELAVQELRIVLKARPRDPEASYLQARMLVDDQRFGDALPYLKFALEGTPSNLPHVHALFGKVYTAQGRTDEAIAEYRQALAADRRGMYHYRLYRLYLRKGDKERAQETLKQVKVRTWFTLSN